MTLAALLVVPLEKQRTIKLLHKFEGQLKKGRKSFTRGGTTNGKSGSADVKQGNCGGGFTVAGRGRAGGRAGGDLGSHDDEPKVRLREKGGAASTGSGGSPGEQLIPSTVA